MKKITASLKYREAADAIWEMAKEYEDKGYYELSKELKQLSSELHDIARQKEKEASLLNGNDKDGHST